VSPAKRARRGMSLLFPVLIAGCAPDAAPLEDASTPEPTMTDSGAVGLEPGPADLFDDDPVPLLPGEGEPREYNLLLVNRLEREVYVFASAGAARVVLDTVPRSDSVYVDIRLRSDQVHLEAEDGVGQVLSSISIDLVEARINRWEMVPQAGDRVALATHSPEPVAPDSRSTLVLLHLSGGVPGASDVRPTAGRQPAPRRMHGRR